MNPSDSANSEKIEVGKIKKIEAEMSSSNLKSAQRTPQKTIYLMNIS